MRLGGVRHAAWHVQCNKLGEGDVGEFAAICVLQLFTAVQDSLDLLSTPVLQCESLAEVPHGISAGRFYQACLARLVWPAPSGSDVGSDNERGAHQRKVVTITDPI